MNGKLRALAEEAAKLRPGPWYFDGRDIFTEAFDEGGHRLLIPLPETFHESARVPDEIARYVAAADPNTILALLDGVTK